MKMRKILEKMPLMNDYSSRQEWEDACWRKILVSKELLQLIITSHERHDLVMRAVAIKNINLGKSYRQISKELFLSLQTISGIKKAIFENAYKSYSERSKKERKRKKYSALSSGLKHKGRPIRTKYGTLHMPD